LQFIFTGTGTSQGIPVIACTCPICTSTDPRDNRLRTSGVLRKGNTTISFDAGPDFRMQMLRNKVNSLDAVVLTHQHKDHIAGLDDVRAYNFILRKQMPLYGNAMTLEHVRTREFYYVFEERKYPGVPQIVLHEIGTTPFQIGEIELMPVPVMHHKLPVLGFRVDDFAYITDANFIPEESMNKLGGLKVLVLNALRREPHLSHFNLKEALEIVEILKPERAYFTHISHLLGKHADLEKELPKGVELAWDGLTIEI
jgi:phosphoribosyl 1,2-cyclic phosphate phosphodiesterase